MLDQRRSGMRLDREELSGRFDSVQGTYNLTDITAKNIQLVLSGNIKGEKVEGSFKVSETTESLFFVNQQGNLKIKLDDNNKIHGVDIKTLGTKGNVLIDGFASSFNRNTSGDVSSYEIGGDVVNYKIRGDVVNYKIRGDVINKNIEGIAISNEIGGDVSSYKIGGDVGNKNIGGDIINKIIKRNVVNDGIGGDVINKNIKGIVINHKNIKGKVTNINNLWIRLYKFFR